MVAKKKSTPKLELHCCSSIKINSRELRLDLWLYDPDSLSVKDASKLYDRDELVGEFGPFACDGLHARSSVWCLSERCWIS
jgi:hypothetical protein